MYTTNFIYKAPAGVLESLKKLFTVLQQEGVNFQQAAMATDNRQLRETLAQFLQESKQYINELQCQIESLGGDPEIDSDLSFATPEVGGLKMATEKEVYEYCSKCENRILVAYREILNQSVILKELRSMVRYQLNGLLCSFLQFRLLKDSFKRI
jgi:uncharacterized protein (TIGR02284 family)